MLTVFKELPAVSTFVAAKSTYNFFIYKIVYNFCAGAILPN
jgi:hypothetical protein